MQTTLIRHREYLGDILSASSGAPTIFQLQRFNIQPGDATTFPWLSSIAANYLHYRVVQIVFTFVSTSATALNSTNTALGIVGGRFEADPTFPTDTNLQQALNSAHASQANPSSSQSWEMPINHSVEYKTVRLGVQPTGTDLRFIDSGYFQIFTAGMQAVNVNLGQLHVSYAIEFSRPYLNSTVFGNTINTAHYQGTTGTQALPFGTGALTATSSFQPTLSPVGTILFPANITAGMYKIDWYGYVAATTTFVGLVPNNLVNCTALQFYSTAGPDLANFIAAPLQALAATQRVMMSIIIRVAAPGLLQAALTMRITTMGTDCTDVEVWITQINGLIAS